MPSSPAVLAGGQLGLLSRSEVAVAGAAAEDLLEALGRVPDPRDPRGHRYPLVPVLEPWGRGRHRWSSRSRTASARAGQHVSA